MHFKKLTVALVMALVLVLSVGTVSIVGEIPSASANGSIETPRLWLAGLFELLRLGTL
jgi:hypothetical protein